MAKKEMASDIKIPKTGKLSFCEGCVEGKMQRKPFKSVGEFARPENYNWYIVIYVGQRIQNQLEEESTL